MVVPMEFTLTSHPSNSSRRPHTGFSFPRSSLVFSGAHLRSWFGGNGLSGDRGAPCDESTEKALVFATRDTNPQSVTPDSGRPDRFESEVEIGIFRRPGVGVYDNYSLPGHLILVHPEFEEVVSPWFA